RPVTEIVEEIQALADAGYNEVVLTGVNLGDFKSINTKSDLDYRKTNPSLRTLIEAILSETDISRLRLSSIEPWDLDPEFFSLWENPRLCRQLHLPLQSGTDSVLKRMGRRITAESYQSLALEAQSAIPNLALTTDVIVGFPGETDQEHNASLSFVQSLKFARLHVFSFSARPGTKAYYIAGKIDAQVIKSRNLEMRQLGKDLQRQFLAGHIGKTMNVLWEKTDHCGNWQGHTGNYIQVTTHSANYLRNTITPTILVELLDDKMRGIIL
ncbi:MAG: radical SAM protein, partial [Anaerolineales bacterium]|nr:radical SAM protein [Anaerolineales bacterium]